MPSTIKKHYHWVIAAVMLIELAVIGGIANNYNGLFLLPVTEDLGIPRASYSLAYSAKYLFGFISTLFSAFLFLRLGNRLPLVAGLALTATGYALLPLSNDIAMLAVANAILGMGDALSCTAAASRVIGDWFHKHKGMVWGVVSASTGLGGQQLENGLYYLFHHCSCHIGICGSPSAEQAAFNWTSALRSGCS